MTKDLELIQQESFFEFIATNDDQGERIDKFIAKKFPNYSRSFLQKLFSSKVSFILKKFLPIKKEKN